jgi:hypothetical protein
MFQLQLFFCSIVTNGTALLLCRDTSLSQELHYCSYLQPAPQTLQKLQQALEQGWRRIPQDSIRRLIESMPRPVRPVLQVNSGQNRY